MRKKPRLASKLDMSASPPTTPPSPRSPSHPAATISTPSKFTLNLRHAQQDARPPMSPQSAASSGEDQRSERTSPHDTIHIDPVTANSPEPVEISLDDNDSFLEEEDEHLRTTRPTRPGPAPVSVQTSRLMDRFLEAGNPEADDIFTVMRRLAEQTNLERPRFNLGAMEVLATRLDEWIGFTRDKRAQWRTIYADQYKDFWSNMTICITKTLHKECSFPHGSAQRILKTLLRLVVNQLEVCAQITTIDIQKFEELRTSGHAVQSSDAYIGFRGLRLLESAFRSNLGVFSALEDRFQVAADETRDDLVKRIFDETTYCLEAPLHLLVVLACSLHQYANVHKHFHLAMKALDQITAAVAELPAEFLEPYPGSPRDPQADAHILVTAVLEIYHNLRRDWVSTPSKSSLAVSAYEESLAGITQCLARCANIYDAPILDEFEKMFPNFENPPNSAVMVSMIDVFLSQDIYWQFIIKGRMELRVFAMDKWQKTLVQLYQSHSTGSERWKDILQPFARFIAEVGFVSYVVGVESHPQLVMRCDNIVAFLAVSDLWRPEYTATICEAVTSSQDKRMRLAILTMICSSPRQFLNSEELLRICHLLCNISFILVDSELFQQIAHFLIGLYEHADEVRSLPPADLQLAPYRLCIWIMQQSCSTSRNDASKLLHHATEMLNGLLSRLATPEQLEMLLHEYLGALEDSNPQCTGTISAISQIINTSAEHVKQPVSLVEDNALTSRVMRSVCSYVETNRAEAPSSLTRLGLCVRLRALSCCLAFDTKYESDAVLEKRLWDHLVGNEAFAALRGLGWEFYSTIARSSPQSPGDSDRPFMSRVIGFLRCLPPDLFDAETGHFVWGYIAHCTLPVNEEVSQDPDMAVQLPMHELVLRTMLEASSQDAAHQACGIFAQMYCDSPPISSMKLSNVAATHIAVVNELVQNLKTAASQLHETTLNADEQRGHARRFRRSLQALEMLLLTVKERIRFTRPPSKSPSPELGNAPLDAKGIPLLKFQAYDQDGKEGEIKALRISEDATLEDLFACLRTRTRFSEMKLICSGQQTSMSEPMQQLVRHRFPYGGLIIVKNLGTKMPPSTKPGKPYLGRSAAERAVLAHFDSFYGFLDLRETSITHQVCVFLLDYLPNSAASCKVTEDPRASCEELFPLDRPHKFKYNLRLLGEEHDLRVRGDDVDVDWLRNVVGALCAACTRPESAQIVGPPETVWSVWLDLTGRLSSILKDHPNEDFSAALGDTTVFVQRLSTKLTVQDIVEPRDGSEAERRNHLAFQSYLCLMHASHHNRAVWQTFQTLPNLAAMHQSFLLKVDDRQLRSALRVMIQQHCTLAQPSERGVSSDDRLAFYWPLARDLISETQTYPEKAAEVFSLVTGLLPVVAGTERKNEMVWSALFRSWMSLLLEHKYTVRAGLMETDHVLHGLALCLLMWLDLSGADHETDESLASRIFDQYLFPPLERPASSMLVMAPGTRVLLYQLVNRLCLADLDSHAKVVQSLELVAADEDACIDTLPWLMEKEKYLRASVGYAGLRNLTNTCYMNSLMTQLFMTEDFRRFFVGEIPLSDQSKASRRLVWETHNLFSRMQDSQRKFIDTEPFAAAVRPYDADEIDVTLQMDVDEFYALLFDRWESQLPNKALKDRFRSFFGGQIVTQIKSVDCSHVSERIEDSAAIQCEVKGKANLFESLEAYVQGDVMEGDNKYKCESCGGRFVTAVKRSCLKEVPSNLIFHLKRFDFDLTTLQRSKINDRFEFPAEIDMTPYTVDYLNDPDSDCPADIFDLVGVLVHAGTAETGHYYSYIKSKIASERGSQDTWLEFNDTEVTEFDMGKIGDQCFGGNCESSAEFNWFKVNSAYMLFYRRRSSSVESVDAMDVANANMASNHSGIPRSSSSAELGVQDPEIQRENEYLLRRYCQLSPPHVDFMRNVLHGSLQHCSTAKDTRQAPDALAVSAKLSKVVCHYLDRIVSRSREVDDFRPVFEQLAQSVKAIPQLANAFSSFLASDAEALRNLLVENPAPEARRLTSGLLSLMVEEAKSSSASDPDIACLYGLASSDSLQDTGMTIDYDGVLPQILLSVSKLMPNLFRACHQRWAEVWELLTRVFCLGDAEKDFLLTHGFFLDALEMLMHGVPAHSTRGRWLHFQNARLGPFDFELDRHENTHHMLRQAKRIAWEPLLNFVDKCFLVLDVGVQPSSTVATRPRFSGAETGRMPLLVAEHELVCAKNGDGLNIMVLRLIDTTDGSSTAALPTTQMTIMASLCRGCTGRTPLADAVGRSIGFAIRSYTLWCLPQILELAFEFCRTSSMREVITSIFDSLNEVSRSVERYDISRASNGVPVEMKAKNLSPLIIFLQEVLNARPRRPVLEALVWQRLTYAMQTILTREEPSVRKEMQTLLQQHLLGVAPAATDGSEPRDTEIIHASAVHVLFHGISKVLQHAHREEWPYRVVEQAIDTFEGCFSWLHALEQDGRFSGIMSEIGITNFTKEVEDVMRFISSLDWNQSDEVTEEDEGFVSGIVVPVIARMTLRY